MKHRVDLGCLLLAVTTVMVISGCGGSGQYEQVPIEEARALNSHISAFYSTTQDLIESANREVNVVGNLPPDVRPEDFEIQLVKNALISCFNASINLTEVSSEPPRGVVATLGQDPLRPLTQRPNLGNVAFCNPSEMIPLESYLEYAPGHISEFISMRVLAVDALRVNLKHVLQERLSLLEENATSSQADAIRLRETARERYEQTMSSDSASVEQQRQTQADYEQIQTELDDIERLLGTIQSNLGDLRRFRRQLVEDVTLRLTEMGNP